MIIEKREIVYETPFCSFVAKTVCGQDSSSPYYSVDLPDYVAVVALTDHQELLMVRQYRAAVEQVTLELPSGCLEHGESVEECGLRELQEETGYVADQVEMLGWLVPDTGRLGNRMCCLFAGNVVVADRQGKALAER